MEKSEKKKDHIKLALIEKKQYKEDAENGERSVTGIKPPA